MISIMLREKGQIHLFRCCLLDKFCRQQKAHSQGDISIFTFMATTHGHFLLAKMIDRISVVQTFARLFCTCVCPRQEA